MRYLWNTRVALVAVLALGIGTSTFADNHGRGLRSSRPADVRAPGAGADRLHTWPIGDDNETAGATPTPAPAPGAALSQRIATLPERISRDANLRILRRLPPERMPVELLADRALGADLATRLLRQNARLARRLSRRRTGRTAGDRSRGGRPLRPARPRRSQHPRTAARDLHALLERSTRHANKALQAYRQGAGSAAARDLARAVAFQKQVLDWLGFTGETIEGNDI